MKRLIALLIGALFALTIAVPPVVAKEKAKKEAKEQRVTGRVQNVKKDASEFQARSGNVVRTIKWTADTKWTFRNGAGSIDDLKDGVRVICLGKFEGNTLVASRVDFREKAR